jgi:hypothetical protein
MYTISFLILFIAFHVARMCPVLLKSPAPLKSLTCLISRYSIRNNYVTRSRVSVGIGYLFRGGKSAVP